MFPNTFIPMLPYVNFYILFSKRLKNHNDTWLATWLDPTDGWFATWDVFLPIDKYWCCLYLAPICQHDFHAYRGVCKNSHEKNSEIQLLGLIPTL